MLATVGTLSHIPMVDAGAETADAPATGTRPKRARKLALDDVTDDHNVDR